MRSLLVIAVLLFSISFYLPAQAQPPLWETDFGDEIVGLTGLDDSQEAIALPFMFPFNGSAFNMAYVGTNGCIQLGGLGSDDDIDYNYWDSMEDFLSDSDPDNPLICPIDSDWDLTTMGIIYYNNSTNPLIITWDGVGADENEDIPSTFQLLLYQDGNIVINFNGMMVGGNFIDDQGEGLVVGVTPSDLPYVDGSLIIPADPGPVNLNQGPFDFGPTAYERWCYDVANSCGVEATDTGLPGPINTAFDLDFWSVCFTPNDDGFDITSGFEGDIGFECGGGVQVPTLSEWGLIAMAGILGIVGFMVMRRRKVSA